MRVLRQLDDLRTVPGPLVLAAGFFDGLHRGHQAVIAMARSAARTAGAQAWALTLDPHPLKILQPDRAPRLLTDPDHRLRLLAAQGLDGCLVLPFTRALADLEPAAFIAQLHAAAPGLHRIVVGPNWTFGHRARGTPALLRELAAGHGFAVTVADPVLSGGEPISSTRIRTAVQAGHLDQAADWLGRPFSVRGPVVAGRQVGRTYGFPTANVDAGGEVRPPPGIYAVRVQADGWTAGGAAYLGPRAPGVVEVHVLDRHDDLYGQTLEIAFRHRLRGHQDFAQPAELIAQIARDVAAARAWLSASA